MIDAVALEVAWRAPFSEDPVEGPPEFQRAVWEKRAGIRQLLGQNADLGARAWEHFLRNVRPEVLPAAGLDGAFEGTPAIVVGAGPSLVEMRPALAHLRDRALILAGGAAIPLVPEAHMGALIDPEVPVSWAQGRTIPLFYQHRVAPEALAAWQGPTLWWPDSSGFPLEEWWCGSKRFPAGWTVISLLVEQARRMGCAPIYLVGVDFAYREGKYPGLPSHEKSGDRIEMDGVVTQRDWWLEARFLERCGAPLVRVGGGLPMAIESGELVGGKGCDVAAQIAKIQPLRWRDRSEELPDVMETLAEPLWDLFAPLFPGDRELHRILFLKRVTTEWEAVCTRVLLQR